MYSYKNTFEGVKIEDFIKHGAQNYQQVRNVYQQTNQKANKNIY